MVRWKKYLKRLGRFLIGGFPVHHVTVVTLSPNELLEGRCALITGGASGIGLAITKAFLQAGAYVVMTGRDERKLKKCFEELDGRFPNRVYFYRMDNLDVSSFEDSLREILTLLSGKKIDILVNNAGVESTAMPHVTESDFDKVVDTNLKGTFFLSQLFGRYMVDNEIEGNILNISSSSSLRPANSPYILSKWGIRALTMGLAKSLAPHGIVVNSIAPGPTQTSMSNLDDDSDITLVSSPIGRYAKSEEVAQMAVVLVSGMGRTVVGDTVFMTGGLGNLTVDDYSRRYSFE